MTFHDPQRQDEASHIRAQLEAIEIERLRLVARLREIEREQKPSPPSLAATVTNGSPAADKIALFRRLFAGRTGCVPRTMGESKIRPQRLCSSLHDRVGSRRLRQAAGSLRRVPEPIVHTCHGRCDRSPSAWRGSPPAQWPSISSGCLSATVRRATYHLRNVRVEVAMCGTF